MAPTHHDNVAATEVRAPADQVLIGLVAQGDNRALAALRARHEVTLYALAFAELRDPVDSEHVVAEAFLEMARRAASFGMDTSVLPWLRQFTRRRTHELRSLRVHR